jgi:hypothetical protein
VLFADKKRLLLFLHQEIVLDTAFLIKFLKIFKSPKSNGDLNAQQQRPFK